jgi:hypothetical protein
MLKSIYITLFFILFIFAGCNQGENEPVSIVSFVQTSYEIITDNLETIEVDIQIEPVARQSSEVVVSIEGANSGDVFTTFPEIENDRLTIPVNAGVGTASFSFIPVEEEIGFENIDLEMEIVEVGDGLIANALEGRFADILIVSNKGFEREAPYSEDFMGCKSGVFPPKGWEEIVIAQNNEQSARWSCISTPDLGIGINAFVSGSNDTQSSEVWFLSPRIDLSALNTPILRFDSDRRFVPDDPDLEAYDVFISTDYNGQDFQSANWSRFQPGYEAISANDPNTDGFSSSGALDLSAFSGEQVVFAFVYRSGAPGSFDATILRISNFSVAED